MKLKNALFIGSLFSLLFYYLVSTDYEKLAVQVVEKKTAAFYKSKFRCSFTGFGGGAGKRPGSVGMLALDGRLHDVLEVKEIADILKEGGYFVSVQGGARAQGRHAQD